MIERIFTPVLAFMMLAGGTYAVGAELLASGATRTVRAEFATVRLPKVEVTGRRASTPVRVAGSRVGCPTAAPAAEAAPATRI
jgi:hypothetical protein